MFLSNTHKGAGCWVRLWSSSAWRARRDQGVEEQSLSVTEAAEGMRNRVDGDVVSGPSYQKVGSLAAELQGWLREKNADFGKQGCHPVSRQQTQAW